ncbi:MAG: hypothetical protein A2W05_08635 [Candidatus Schekmanbacteria bacterium RBG_16_38_10]|uniref:DUF4258 domain-containing protein n=1 Tax=Candidatus Schekmanbacteria bacterium RBG_16_38_10 TaxID=1817879 RepID=A0A1F7RUQ1_9BACT|nr:MAG: hypothetical protein A2W05_08635 [Candidatus Schekmanbacteria bacterium RBG_16_38_10]
MKTNFKIKNKVKHLKGIIYNVEVKRKIIQILITFHAQSRIRKWELTEAQVIETLLKPEEVLKGHYGRYIAHRKYNNHLMRAIYEYEENIPVIVTVYFPLSNRYYEGGGRYEDKILS